MCEQSTAATAKAGNIVEAGLLSAHGCKMDARHSDDATAISQTWKYIKAAMEHAQTNQKLV